jgi:hypothetical protein
MASCVRLSSGLRRIGLGLGPGLGAFGDWPPARLVWGRWFRGSGALGLGWPKANNSLDHEGTSGRPYPDTAARAPSTRALRKGRPARVWGARDGRLPTHKLRAQKSRDSRGAIGTLAAGAQVDRLLAMLRRLEDL